MAAGIRLRAELRGTEDTQWNYHGCANGNDSILDVVTDFRLADFVPPDRLPSLAKAHRVAVVAKLGGEDQLHAEVRLYDNFCIAADGLHFIYNEYEVASYAAGAAEVVVNL